MSEIIWRIWCVILFLYYIIEGIVLFFIPAKYRRKDVKGQIVLITGAGSGIGRLMAINFAKLGCRLVLWDINGDSVQQVAAECQELGAQAKGYACDISSSTDVSKAAEKVKYEVGDVDILINNAGVVTGKKILDCPDSMIQKTFDVNAVAHFWTLKAFLPTMLARNKGHIVTVASAAGHFGVNGAVDYCSSKFAAVGIDDSLRSELWSQKKYGVNCTVICPYLITTGMFEGCQSRFPSILPTLKPEDVAEQIVEAVQTNKAVVIIPRILAISLGIKNFLPIKVGLLLSRSLGSTSFMDGFRGRAKQH